MVEYAGQQNDAYAKIKQPLILDSYRRKLTYWCTHNSPLGCDGCVVFNRKRGNIWMSKMDRKYVSNHYITRHITNNCEH